jgi:hypothetical protein
MGFFARGGGQDDGEQSEALARIEAGGIPAEAEERLKALRRGESLFTSGLSVNEFALLGRMGPQPLAQVMGASVVRSGWQYLPALDPTPVAMPRSMGYAARFGASGPSATGYQLSNPYAEPRSARSAATSGTPPRCASSTR